MDDKTKVTYYLPQDTVMKLNDLQHDIRKETKDKPPLSTIVNDAILSYIGGNVSSISSEITVTSRQIAEVFGREHKDILRLIAKINSSLFTPSIYTNRGKEYPEYIIGYNGCKAIVDQTRNNTDSKQRLIDFVNETFGNTVETVFLSSRFEIVFIDNLEDTLQAIGYSLETQYPVDSYRIDAYIPELNIAIEYDEEQHYTPSNAEKDIERQQYIKDKLGCTFVRCDYRDSDAYNVGLVVKAIIGMAA